MERKLSNYGFRGLSVLELEDINGGDFFKSIGEIIGYTTSALSSFIYWSCSAEKDYYLKKCECK